MTFHFVHHPFTLIQIADLVQFNILSVNPLLYPPLLSLPLPPLHVLHREPDVRERHKVSMPTMEDFCSLEKVGGDWDGGKWICGLSALKDE